MIVRRVRVLIASVLVAGCASGDLLGPHTPEGNFIARSWNGASLPAFCAMSDGDSIFVTGGKLEFQHGDSVIMSVQIATRAMAAYAPTYPNWYTVERHRQVLLLTNVDGGPEYAATLTDNSVTVLYSAPAYAHCGDGMVRYERQ